MVGYTKLFLSKKDQGARTPSGLIKQIQQMFLPKGVKLWDPTPHGWTPKSKWDGLRDPWKDYNFINPPFDKTGKFFERAIAQQDKCTSFFLVPCRFHTRYFFDAAPYMKHIYLLENEVNFVGYTQSLPVALCLVVFGKKFNYKSQKLKEVTIRPQKHLYLCSVPNRTTLNEAISLGPKKTYTIGNKVSKPLQTLVNKLSRTTRLHGIAMPSRLENKVLWNTVVSNPNVTMVFFTPTLCMPDKLFNGTLLAIFNGQSEIFERSRKVPVTLLIHVDTTHSEQDLNKVLNFTL
jgi:hypothetical protein